MNKPINKINKRSTRCCFGNLEALMLLYLYRPYSRQQLVNDTKNEQKIRNDADRVYLHIRSTIQRPRTFPI